MTRTKCSFEICKAFGIPFYINGSCYASVASDVLVPAWTVRTSEKDSKCNMRLEHLVSVVDFEVSAMRQRTRTRRGAAPEAQTNEGDDTVEGPKERPVEGQEEGSPAEAMNTFSVTMKIPVLVPKEEWLGHEIGELVRPITEEEQESKKRKADGTAPASVDALGAKGVASAFKRKRAQLAEAGDQGKSKVGNIAARFRHLMR